MKNILGVALATLLLASGAGDSGFLGAGRSGLLEPSLDVVLSVPFGSKLPKFMSTSAAMFAASPVTASIAVTSLETMLSAVRVSALFWSLAA